MHRRKTEGRENGKSLMMLHNYEAGRRVYDEFLLL